MSNVSNEVREYLQQIGRKGGKVCTPRKAQAVRRNGKLGGRPPKAKADK